MTKTKIINETRFPSIPTSAVDDIVEAASGNPQQAASFSSDGIYDWGDQIAKLGRADISSNQFATYLQDYQGSFGSIVSSGSSFGFIPPAASSTKGLIDDNDDFKHKFFPDFNEAGKDPDNPKRGRFLTQGEYDAQTTDPFAGNGYTSFNFKYSADGVAAPTNKPIDNTYFGPSGAVTVTTHSSPEDFNLPNWTPSTPDMTSSGDGFSPDPDSSDRGSGPSDGFTPPTLGGGGSGGDDDEDNGNTTPPPQTTAPPE